MDTTPDTPTTTELADRVCRECFAPVSPGAMDPLTDSPTALAMYEAFVEAFPDARFTPEWRVVEGDRAAMGGVMTGTHLGPWLDVPPSGRHVEFLAISLLQFRDGKLVDLMVVQDSLAVAVQIGAAAPLGPKACEVVAPPSSPESPIDPGRQKWC